MTEQPVWRPIIGRPNGLTPTDSQFLVTIWKCQQEFSEGGVPWDKIAAHMSPWWRLRFHKDPSKNPYEGGDGMKEDMVRKVASELAWDEERKAGYVVPLLGDEASINDSKDKDVIGYGLVDRFMIRRPHTATALLELEKFDFDPAKPGEKPIEDFLIHLVATFRVPCAQAMDDVAYGISKDYLIPYPARNPTHVSYSNRFRYESRYLKKLTEFDPKRVVGEKRGSSDPKK